MATEKRGKVIRAFSGPLGRGRKGDIIVIPDGADWVKAGFVEPITKKRRRRKKAEINE